MDITLIPTSWNPREIYQGLEKPSRPNEGVSVTG